MSKKMIYLMFFVIVLSVAGSVQAAWIVWNGSAGDRDWFNAANWDGVPPWGGGGAQLGVYDVPNPDITGLTINTGGILQDSGVNNAFDVKDATVNLDGWTLASNASPGEAILNVYDGGAINMSGVANLTVSNWGRATLNMYGGAITISNSDFGLSVGQCGSAVGHVQLDGGTISVGFLQLAHSCGGTGSMDITGGTLILNGDDTADIQNFIDLGRLTVYDGDRGGVLEMDYDVTNAGRTTVTAGHTLNPIPANGSIVGDGPAQLEWTLPEPNQPGGVVDCVVYFGTNPTVEFNPVVVDRESVESVAVTLEAGTTYYWALDLYDSGISPADPYWLAPVFTFKTVGNMRPIVDAGDDVQSWLDNGERLVQLDGSVTDDGKPGPLTIEWTVIAEPNEANPATFDDPNSPNATITMKEVGTYTLELQATDGEFIVSDTMEIILYSDSCEHARNQGGFSWLAGDINHDCKVNFLDFGNFAATWLDENYSE